MRSACAKACCSIRCQRLSPGGGGMDSESPRDMETTADVAHRGVEDLEAFGTSEPQLEGVDDLGRTVELGGPSRQQRPHCRSGLEALGHADQVAGGDGLQEEPGDRPPRRRRGCAGFKGNFE